MAVNANVLTADSQAYTNAAASGYQDAVAAHVGGDWSGHNQLQYYPEISYVETSTYDQNYNPTSNTRTINGVVAGQVAGSLRIQLSNLGNDPTADGVFTCPVIASGVPVPVNGIAPVILQQPASVQVAAGASAIFTVVAASGAPVTYQWYLGTTALAGAVYSTFTVVSASTANAGAYTVVITSVYGTTTSAVANLTLS